MSNELPFPSYLGLALIVTVCSISVADLPDIEVDELREVVLFHDEMVPRFSVSYSVDETFEEKAYTRRMPKSRHLQILYRKDSSRYYFDVTIKKRERADFRIVDAFNGDKRRQWTPEEKKGDVFQDGVIHAWPTPLEFGMTVNNRDSALGANLVEAEVLTLRTEVFQDHNVYFVEALNSDGMKWRAWIDPKVGWRARRIEVDKIKGGLNYDAVTEFKEVEPGVWFPHAGTFKRHATISKETRETVVANVRHIKIEEVKIPARMGDSEFTVDYPDGTGVYDHIVGVSYIIGRTSLEGLDDIPLDSIMDDVDVSTKANEHDEPDSAAPDVKPGEIDVSRNIPRVDAVKGRRAASNDDEANYVWGLVALAGFLTILFVLYRKSKSP